ncbi:MAG: hypothetical protein ABSE73_07075 [Planctomycetota bacterium]
MAQQRSSVPDNGIIQLTDYGFRDWGPELVRYTLDTRKFEAGRLVLLAGDGKAVPFQIQDGVLMFVASVKKGQTATYTLQRSDQDRSEENSALTQRQAGKALEVGNEFFSLRLPKPQKKEFAKPAAAAKAVAPILAWKQAGFDWIGGARFHTERKVSRLEVRMVDDGPATVAYEARYHFEPAGEYVWQARVSTGVPVAIITEEYDFGALTAGHDFLMLALSENWKPQELGFLTGEGPSTLCTREPLGAYLERKSKEVPGPIRNVGWYTPPPAYVPLTPPSPPGGEGRVRGNPLLLEKIVPGCPWGLRAGLELRATRDEGGHKTVNSISVCPYHTGSWRRTNSLIAWHSPERGVELALPISARLSHWYLDLTDDESPFSSQEHDQELPASYGRRVWALGCGLDEAARKLWPEFAESLTKPDYPWKISDPIVKTRIVLGYIGLDRYKEWLTEWPEDKAKAVYPRCFATPEIAARVRAALDQHPEKALLSKLYIIDGKDETGAANAKTTIEGFKTGRGGDDWNIFGLSNYRQTYQFPWVVYADSALAWPKLPPEQRKEIRRFLALQAYLFSEPDQNPRGSGVHEGNPNMPIGRTEALALLATMLPDHPRYGYWMEQLKAITIFRIASNTEVGGAWFEPPIYQFYGPTRALALAQIALRNAGVADLSKEGWHKAAMLYDAHLTMPEVRAKGWRPFPGMGNSGLTLEGIFGISMSVFDASDREFAGFLRYMHRLSSGNNRVSLTNDPEFSFGFVPDIPEKPGVLKTTFIPGYGVAFRAHYGTPDETAMLFRCGYNHSHWDMDDLNVILCGKGAPLSPGTGYQYYSGPAVQNDAIYHNRVKVGKLNLHEPYGRVENVLQDYGFGAAVDYAVGREYYPPEYFDDGKGEMEWRRHVLFLKSAKPDGANYFVMRDTFPGGKDRAAWWYWFNLDTADMISVDGKAFDKDKAALNQVVPEEQMQALTGRALEMRTKYGAGTAFRFASKEPLTARTVMTWDYNVAPNYHHRTFGKELGVIYHEDKETKTTLRIAGTAAEGFFCLVYPHKDAEQPAACTQLADSVLKVVTSESTDFCFVSDTPLNFKQEDVVFTGKAGAVRVFPDRVVLCLSSGVGQVGYEGCVCEGCGPFERTVALADLKPSLQKIEGGYEKKIVNVELGEGITVTGELPFEARLDGRVIRIKTSGRARVLLLTKPAWMIRPELKFDGRQWMAGWTDEAGSDWGRWSRCKLMAVSTLDGAHELVVTDMVFPKVWERQFTPVIGVREK